MSRRRRLITADDAVDAGMTQVVLWMKEAGMWRSVSAACLHPSLWMSLSLKMSYDHRTHTE